MNNFIDFAVKAMQLSNENDFEQLDELLINAEQYFLDVNDVEKLIRLYIIIHELVHSKGNIEKTIEYLEKFISFYEVSNIGIGKYHYYSSKAFLEHIFGNEKDVLENLQLAYDENIQANNIVAKTAIMCNIGYTYFLLERYDDAYYHLIEAEKLIKEYNLEGAYVHYKIGINLAKVYNRKKILDKAKEYLSTIVEYEEFKTSLIERIDYYATYAEYEANVGLITEAIDHYKLAISYAEQNNMYIELRTYFSGLIAILRQNKYFDEVKIYEEKYNRVIDDLEIKNKNFFAKKALMDAEIKKRLSIKQLKLKKITKSKKSTDYDELTECYSAEYMNAYISKLKFLVFSKKQNYILFLKLDELKPILEEQGQIYAEKMVYELSKLIHETFGKTIIGRTRFNEFIILNQSLNESDILELVESLKQKVKKEKVILNKKAYKLSLLGVIVDLKKLREIHKMEVVGLEQLTQLLRGRLSTTIEVIHSKDFKNL